MTGEKLLNKLNNNEYNKNPINIRYSTVISSNLTYDIYDFIILNTLQKDIACRKILDDLDLDKIVSAIKKNKKYKSRNINLKISPFTKYEKDYERLINLFTINCYFNVEKLREICEKENRLDLLEKIKE